MAFFGCLYYAANRPGEAASLREDDFTLPEEGWGEVLLSTSMPRVGSGWTDTGESFDTRGLKKRARKATRPVPIPPSSSAWSASTSRSSVPLQTAGCSVRPRVVACCPRSTGKFGKRLDSRC